MPLTVLHAAVGVAAGASCYILDRTVVRKPIEPRVIADNLLDFALAGVLPDLIEPPTDRRHRSFFHSFTSLAGGVYALARVQSRTDLDDEQKRLKRARIAAYLSHLALDSRTPAGLPLAF